MALAGGSYVVESRERGAQPFRLFKAIVVVAIVLQLVLLIFAPVDGHDADVHLFWLTGFAKQFAAGTLYPRWIENSFAGYGAPIFDLYPPAAYFIGALVGQVLNTANGELLFKLVAAIGYVLSFFSMRLLLGEFSFTKAQIFWGALFYAVNPYRFFTLFTRSALPEHLAMAIIPIVFWAAYRVFRQGPRLREFSILSLAIAALVLTNIPSSSAVLIVLGVVSLSQLRHSTRAGLCIIGACAVGTVGGSAILLPAYDAQHYLQVDRLWEPLDHSPLLEIFNSGYYLNRTLLPILFVSLVVATYYLLRAKLATRGVWKWLLLTIVVLQLPLFVQFASPYVLPLRLLQFPWRTNVVGMMALVPVVLYSKSIPRRLLLACVSIATLLTVISGASSILGARLGDHTVANNDMRPEYYSKFMYAPDTREVLFRDAPDISAAGKVGTVERSPTHRVYDVRLGQPETVVVKLYYWPYWVVTVNGQNAEVLHDRYGRTVLALETGVSHVDFRLPRTAAEQWGEWLSGIVLVSLLGLWALSVLTKERRANTAGGVAGDFPAAVAPEKRFAL